MQGTVTGQPSFGATCPHGAAAAPRCCPAGGVGRGVWEDGDLPLQVRERSVVWWLGIGTLRVGVEMQLVFWFCASVAPSLMEDALLCSWAFCWVGQHRVQQEISDCSRNLASSLGIWLSSLSLQLGGHQHFILPVYLPGKLISMITSLILPIYLPF